MLSDISNSLAKASTNSFQEGKPELYDIPDPTNIIKESVPVFEKASVDEFYIDLSGMQRFFDPLLFLKDLRNKIMDQTGLPISCGISVNKFIAKIATGQAKPNGFLYVPFGKEKEFLSALPVEEIPGVGKSLWAKLKSLNIHTIAHLQIAGEEKLVDLLGNTGQWLWEKSEGKSNSSVINFREAKSISSENTFFTT